MAKPSTQYVCQAHSKMSLNIEIQRNTPISNFNKPNSSLNRRHLVGPVFICSLYILKFDVYFEVRYTVKLIFSPFRTQNRGPKYTFYTLCLIYEPK